MNKTKEGIESPSPVSLNSYPSTPIRLIVNPVSGKGRGAAVAEQASRILQNYGLPHEIVLSHSPTDPTQLARAAVKEQCLLVVGVGGDGLVLQVANELGPGAA